MAGRERWELGDRSSRTDDDDDDDDGGISIIRAPAVSRAFFRSINVVVSPSLLLPSSEVAQMTQGLLPIPF